MLRYTDFLVNEILPNGHVVHLDDLKAPKAGGSTAPALPLKDSNAVVLEKNPPVSNEGTASGNVQGALVSAVVTPTKEGTEVKNEVPETNKIPDDNTTQTVEETNNATMTNLQAKTLTPDVSVPKQEEVPVSKTEPKFSAVGQWQTFAEIPSAFQVRA